MHPNKPFSMQTQKQHRNKFVRASHLYFEFLNFLPCLIKIKIKIKSNNQITINKSRKQAKKKRKKMAKKEKNYYHSAHCNWNLQLITSIPWVPKSSLSNARAMVFFPTPGGPWNMQCLDSPLLTWGITTSKKKKNVIEVLFSV